MASQTMARGFVLLVALSWVVANFVNGDEVPKRHSYMVSVQKKVGNGQWNHTCSGSIITRLHVLTAAQCNKPQAEMSILAGTTKLHGGSAGQRFGCYSFVGHPNYTDNYFFDIAVVTISTPFVYSRTV